MFPGTGNGELENPAILVKVYNISVTKINRLIHILKGDTPEVVINSSLCEYTTSNNASETKPVIQSGVLKWCVGWLIPTHSEDSHVL